jgi:hypothetical protein
MSHREGALRILSDVTVRHLAEGDLIAISDKPRTCGDVLTLELMNGMLVRTFLRVASSTEVIERGRSNTTRITAGRSRADTPGAGLTLQAKW